MRTRAWQVLGSVMILGLGMAARADDVKVQVAPNSGFVVTDQTGAQERFKVTDSGAVSARGLATNPNVESQPLCYNLGTGRLGSCTAIAPGPVGLVDNGDGTVTDHGNGLMWEQKTGDPDAAGVDCSTTPCNDPHDVRNRYEWCLDVGNDFTCDNPGNKPDGGAFTDFLERINGKLCASADCPCLGGHCDWRLPTLSELQTIVDETQGFCSGGSGACIAPIFGPTAPGGYWSASTDAGSPDVAWGVFFFDGDSGNGNKAVVIRVRAVRGGL